MDFVGGRERGEGKGEREKSVLFDIDENETGGRTRTMRQHL